jgi:hypothetical protein
LATCSAAQAQFATGFENPPYLAAPAGILLTGQDGWYNPVAGSADYNAYTYFGNALGIAPNPLGSAQMVAGRFAGLAAFARAQHPNNFAAGGVWTISFDVLGMYNGTLPTVDNLGSFSLQPSGTARYWQQALQWGTANLPTATQYDINYGIWDIAPYNQVTPTFISPGAAWRNIPVNNWIRQWTTWDFTTNRILTIAIQNLTAGGPIVVVDVSALPYHLRFGPGGVGPLPTDFRFFAGGGAGTTAGGGNITAWDNVNVSNNPCDVLLRPCRADVTGDTLVNVNDLLAVINTWGATGPPRPQGDCDPSPTGSCTVNVNDLLTVINAWGACPQPSGACCMPGGICAPNQIASACATAGGTYQGDGTSCSPNPCPPPPCTWTCPAGSVAEGEPCRNADPDSINGGCNSTPTVYGTIAPNVTICGMGSTYGAGSRDTDWYLFTTAVAGTYHVRVNAQFTALVGILTGGFASTPCLPAAAFVAGSSATTTAAQNCTTVDAGTVALVPGTYAVFVAPSVFTGFPCTGGAGGANNYWVTLVSP